LWPSSQPPFDLTNALTTYAQIFIHSVQATLPVTMVRVAIAAQLSGMASNPYPKPKVQQPYLTNCELCDRIIPTKDWNAHKNSKKHRESEAKDRAKAGGTDINGFGGDATGFTADTGGNNFTSTTATDSGGAPAADAAWGAADFGANIGTSGYVNNNSGGGGRACFGCGSEDHQKRDCPKGGPGRGQACFNCGEVGYVISYYPL
jgi:cellular nucleic acid-binding protein